MENEIIYVGKIELEDSITFHEAEFEITDGYYYNSGRNNLINNVIKNLYDLRLELEIGKRNPAQVVIKLLMNSMHGKTSIIPVETDTIIKYSRGYFEKCTSLTYKYLDIVLEVNGRYYN